jgi:anti-anti-sigma factor
MATLFELVGEGDCLVVVPIADLRETLFEQLCEETTSILAAFDGSTMRHLVVDFHRTQEFGSSAVGFFIAIWKQIRERKASMAFCNLSAYQKEILNITKIDKLWAICGTREEALKATGEKV